MDTSWLDDDQVDDQVDNENDNDPEKEVLKRKSRNQSEKKRRDQFNVLINELMFLVSGNTRKMDKTTVLQATIAYLRRHKELQAKNHTTAEEINWKPKCLSNQEFGQLMLDALDGFLIAISRQGQILYTSDNVMAVIGYSAKQLVTQSIYNFIHESERQEVYKVLSSHAMSTDQGSATGKSSTSGAGSEATINSNPNSNSSSTQPNPSMQTNSTASTSNSNVSVKIESNPPPSVGPMQPNQQQHHSNHHHQHPQIPLNSNENSPLTSSKSETMHDSSHTADSPRTNISTTSNSTLGASSGTTTTGHSSKTMSAASPLQQSSPEHIEICCHIKRGILLSSNHEKNPTQQASTSTNGLAERADEFEYVKIVGGFRKSQSIATMGLPSLIENSTRTADERTCFIGCISLMTPLHGKQHVGVCEHEISQFQIKFSLELNCIYVDTRATALIGYQPLELLGTSGYELVHPDDLERIEETHLQLKEHGEIMSNPYRILTKGQQWIWVKTKFTVTANRATRVPDRIIGMFYLVSLKELAESGTTGEYTSKRTVRNIDDTEEDEQDPATLPNPTLTFDSPNHFWGADSRISNTIDLLNHIGHGDVGPPLDPHMMSSPAHSGISSSGTSNLTSVSQRYERAQAQPTNEEPCFRSPRSVEHGANPAAGPSAQFAHPNSHSKSLASPAQHFAHNQSPNSHKNCNDNSLAN